jgi:hypothetical protein
MARLAGGDLAILTRLVPKSRDGGPFRTREMALPLTAEVESAAMTVGVFPQIQAAVLYLLPVIVVLVCASERRSAIQEIALFIPATLAFDFLTCLLASLIVPLDVALVGSRVLWLVAGGGWIAKRKHLLAMPEGIDRRQIAITLACGIAALAFSMSITRPYSIWDRQFHIPLLTSMRGQSLPFRNVFQSNVILHYHFSGDIVAAALQALSGARLHASLALALAHDIMFALFAACLGAWVAALSARKFWILPAVMAVLLSGPAALLRTGLGSQVNGYSYYNFLTISFRPHVSVAALLLLGAFAAVVLPLSRGGTSRVKSVTALLVCVAGLAVTDEPSAALICLGVGTAWLVSPGLLAVDRKRGALVLVALAAAIVVPNLLFRAALSPGSPVQSLRLVPWRSPGTAEPPLSLETLRGGIALLTDIAPLMLVYLGLLSISWRERAQRTWVIAVCLGVILLASLIALTRVDVNGVHYESHRFMTSSEILLPIVALLLLARLPAGQWERVPILGALFLSVASTVFWYQFGIGSPEEFFTNNVDCRESAGAHLFEAPKPTYIVRSVWFPYAGCRPVMSPGLPNDWRDLYTGGPDGGRRAFATLHTEFVKANEGLAAACPIASDADPVCRYARSHRLCVPSGKAFEVCQISPQDRLNLLASTW